MPLTTTLETTLRSRLATLDEDDTKEVAIDPGASSDRCNPFLPARQSSQRYSREPCSPARSTTFPAEPATTQSAAQVTSVSPTMAAKTSSRRFPRRTPRLRCDTAGCGSGVAEEETLRSHKQCGSGASTFESPTMQATSSSTTLRVRSTQSPEPLGHRLHRCSTRRRWKLGWRKVNAVASERNWQITAVRVAPDRDRWGRFYVKRYDATSSVFGQIPRSRTRSKPGPAVVRGDEKPSRAMKAFLQHAQFGLTIIGALHREQRRAHVRTRLCDELARERVIGHIGHVGSCAASLPRVR